ncbi:head scaffolding protein [Stenotrophomonas phage vB_SmaM_Bhz51]
MNINENLKALGEKLGLDEEAVTALAEAFDAACSEAEAKAGETHAAEIAALNEAHEAEIKELKAEANAYGERIYENTLEETKQITQAAVDEFIAENKEQFVTTEKYARLQESFEGLKTALEEVGFTLNENRQVEELQSQLAEANRAYEDTLSELNESRKAIEGLERAALFESHTKDLSDLQREKLKTLMENVNADSSEDYVNSIELLSEQVKLQEDKKEDDEDDKEKKSDEGKKEDGDDKKDKEKKSSPLTESVVTFLQRSQR